MWICARIICLNVWQVPAHVSNKPLMVQVEEVCIIHKIFTKCVTAKCVQPHPAGCVKHVARLLKHATACLKHKRKPECLIHKWPNFCNMRLHVWSINSHSNVLISQGTWFYLFRNVLTLQVPTQQNGLTHSNNLSADANELFESVWPFYGVGV